MFLSLEATWVRGVATVGCAALLFAFAGCDPKETAAPSNSGAAAAATSAPTTTVTAAAIQGKPQPKLPTVKLWLGAQELTAEIARTTSMVDLSPEVRTGMMFRTNMLENEAMLFVFPRAHQT